MGETILLQQESEQDLRNRRVLATSPGFQALILDELRLVRSHFAPFKKTKEIPQTLQCLHPRSIPRSIHEDAGPARARLDRRGRQGLRNCTRWKCIYLDVQITRQRKYHA